MPSSPDLADRPRWALRGRLVTSGAEVADGWVLIEGARVAAVGTGPPPAAVPAVDLGGFVLAPGFVDVHVHGGGGRQVAGADEEEVAAAIAHVARHHARHGTTALVATTVSDTPARLLAVARASRRATGSRREDEAEVLGLHLEGPWLAPSRAGAHAPIHLRPPDATELAALVAASGATVRLVTFAPELDAGHRLLRAGLAAGITMSVGHTEADVDTVQAAFAAGARHVTHLGNAMPGLDRRSPGPIAAALADGRVTVELIADGVHVHPAFLSLVGSVAPGRVVAVTDAVAACGLAPGRHLLGAAAVDVDGERVVLAEAPTTLAGSLLTMDRAVAALVGAGFSVADAVLAATATPARVVGAERKGHLRAGADADVVVLDADLVAAATVIAGRVVWDPGRLLSGPT